MPRKIGLMTNSANPKELLSKISNNPTVYNVAPGVGKPMKFSVCRVSKLNIANRKPDITDTKNAGAATKVNSIGKT